MQFHWCLCEVLQSTSLTTREPLRISMMSKTQRLVKAPLAACAGPHLNARFFWAPDLNPNPMRFRRQVLQQVHWSREGCEDASES